MKTIDDFDKGELKKESGVTAGFIKTISNGLNEEYYMLKPIPLSDNNLDIRDTIGRCNALAEYSFSKVFKTILGEQAPDIGLVKGRDNKLFLSSKFIENFSHADTFLASDPGRDKFSPNIMGIEKVVITSLLCGDTDLHAGNVGIITRKNYNGRVEYFAAKIDHGAAGNLDSVNNYALSIKDYYLEREYTKLLPFDLGETRKAIKEVLEACPTNSITKAANDLAKLKVDTNFTDIILFETKNLKDFEQYLTERKEKLKEFDAKLSLVESINHSDPQWKKTGAWIEAADDPISWKANNQQKLVSKLETTTTKFNSLNISDSAIPSLKDLPTKKILGQLNEINNKLQPHISYTSPNTNKAKLGSLINKAKSIRNKINSSYTIGS